MSDTMGMIDARAMRSPDTPEQAARDMLERMGVEGAQDWSAGEVVELANLLHLVRDFAWEDVDTLREACVVVRVGDAEVMTDERATERLHSLADRLAALLPPRPT